MTEYENITEDYQDTYVIQSEIKGIVFDLDNTLVDIGKAEAKAAEKFCREHPAYFLNEHPEEFAIRWHEATLKHYRLYEIGEISIQEQRRRRMREICNSPHLKNETADLLYASYHFHFERMWSLYPDVMICLRRLQRFKLAVITNGPKEVQLNKMRVLGIDTLFSSHIFPCDIGVFKPDKQIFLTCCERMGLLAEECLSVGDSIEFDIRPCQEIGMKTLLIDRQRRWSEFAPCPRVSSLTSIEIAD